MLKKSCKEVEMDRNSGDKPMTQEWYYSTFKTKKFVYNFRRIDYLHFIYSDSYRMLDKMYVHCLIVPFGDFVDKKLIEKYRL